MRTMSWLAVAGLLGLTCLGRTAMAAGDRGIDVNAIYPPSVFHQNGGHVLNVKTDFGAVGDGKADDTKAFIAMFNFLLAELTNTYNNAAADPSGDAAGGKAKAKAGGKAKAKAAGKAAEEGGEKAADKAGEKAACNTAPCQYVMYVPNGTYRVTNTIEYTRDTYWKVFRGVRLIGQSRAGTIIQLADRCPGFGAGAHKVVLEYGHADFPDAEYNNWMGHNFLCNMTIDTGRGNPGAIGVNFLGANNARMDNVLIRSGDGQGEIGLWGRIGIVSGYYSNITVQGFDVGVKYVPYHFADPTLEHITLAHQNVAGLESVDCIPVVRDLFSDQNNPAVVGVKLSSGGAHVVLVDSVLSNTNSPLPAIDIVKGGHLFARSVAVKGYAHNVKRTDGTFLGTGDIAEFVSDPIQKFSSDSPNVSMNLPVEEPPTIAWEQDVANQWDSPDAHGAKGDGEADDSDALQAALDSGKPVIYFPKQGYNIGKEVTVPATVKRIDFLGCCIFDNGFNVNAPSTEPILFQNLNRADGVSDVVRLSAQRTVVLDSLREATFENVDHLGDGTRVFVNNCNQFTEGHTLTQQKAWCRFINSETRLRPNFVCDAGGVMWVLGYKVEGSSIGFQVQNGGVLEIVGGLINQPNGKLRNDWDGFNDADKAAYINLNSNVSITAATNCDHDADYEKIRHIVKDVQGDTTNRVAAKDLPLRVGRNNQHILPLYVSYDPAVVPHAP
ncbi:MAG: glycosyl hydrolase family 28-related protein [Candidatus Sumerlaeota bacterium]|nr:glycosyl hydrolase family 28-related protein [Candidatus Sumerlaeota bacterium]